MTPKISNAQRRVLNLLISHGGSLTLETIAARLFLTHNTVKSHTHAIYKAYGVHNRRELLREVARRG